MAVAHGGYGTADSIRDYTCSLCPTPVNRQGGMCTICINKCRSPLANPAEHICPIPSDPKDITSANKLLHTLICKQFDSGYFYGHVIQILPTVDSGIGIHYKIQYSDGDEEDLSATDLAIHVVSHRISHSIPQSRRPLPTERHNIYPETFKPHNKISFSGQNICGGFKVRLSGGIVKSDHIPRLQYAVSMVSDPNLNMDFHAVLDTHLEGKYADNFSQNLLKDNILFCHSSTKSKQRTGGVGLFVNKKWKETLLSPTPPCTLKKTVTTVFSVKYE